MGLVSIGEFSRLSRLSPKALRLYDELGLLVPDHVDAATGYRWYADTQFALRDIPARSLLSLMRRAHQDEVMQIGREFFIHRMMRGGVARVEGIAGAPFTVYYGEVSGDSDGPVEFCWPVPSEQAAEIAAKFPDLTLRTEPAHQEAFVGQGKPGAWSNEAEIEVAIEGLIAWASEQQRQPSSGVSMILVFNPANLGAGPDTQFALALR